MQKQKLKVNPAAVLRPSKPVPQEMIEGFPVETVGGLPVIDDIPDHIYEITPVPESLDEANRMIEGFKHRITQINIQLQQSFEEVSHQFNGHSQGYHLWRRKLKNAWRTANSQCYLIRLWKAENKERLLAAERQAQQIPTGLSLKEFINLKREVKFLRHSLQEAIEDCLAYIPEEERSRCEAFHANLTRILVRLEPTADESKSA